MEKLGSLSPKYLGYTLILDEVMAVDKASRAA
jgi:hypothetical protein